MYKEARGASLRSGTRLDFVEVINKRRSVRAFLPEEIPDKILHIILEAGREAVKWNLMKSQERSESTGPNL